MGEIPQSISAGRLPRAWQEFLHALPGNTNVAIAAAVTSYSRILINQYKLQALNLGLELYYSDTDSLVLNGSLPSEVCDSAALGKLKLEHTFKEGIFAMPKVNYLELKDGTTVTKCKGYPGKFSKDQYKALLEDTTLQLSVTKWNRSLRSSSVQIQRGILYSISPTFNKRDKVFENGVWTDTKPLILRNSSL